VNGIQESACKSVLGLNGLTFHYINRTELQEQDTFLTSIRALHF